MQTLVPDPGREGRDGALRALLLAGVRPASPTPGEAAPNLGRLLATASTATPAPTSAPAPTDARAANPPALPPTLAPAPAPAALLPAQPDQPHQPVTHPPAALEQAAAQGLREHLAEQVFKPRELADYDRVVPLPLAANGLPTPARIAVASRSTGGGASATFVRVDAELARLGTVSIRLSGADAGGPLAITLVASSTTGGLLAEELPALIADLRALGVEAGVRVVADG